MRIQVLLLFLILAGCGNSENQKQRFLIRGNEALQQQNHREAIRFFKEAIELDPCYTPAINNLGTVHFQMAHYRQAVLEYDKALSCDPDNVETYLNRSNAYYELNELYRAMDDLEYVKKYLPDSSIVFFRIGLVKTKMRKYKEAVANFDKAYALDSTNAETLVNRGTISYYLKDLEKAENDLRDALKINPLESNAYNALALVFVEQDQFEKALQYVNKALELEPGQPYFLNNRGYIFLELNKLQLAKSDIDRSITIDPRNAWAYRNKGWYYYKMGQYTDAVKLLKDAIALDPLVDNVHLFLGQTYMKMGEKVKSCAAFREALSKGIKVPQDFLAACK